MLVGGLVLISGPPSKASLASTHCGPKGRSLCEKVKAALPSPYQAGARVFRDTGVEVVVNPEPALADPQEAHGVEALVAVLAGLCPTSKGFSMAGSRGRRWTDCLLATERPSQTQLGSGGQEGREEFLPEQGFHD